MKIINLEEFRKLPPNTLYCKFEPDFFEEIQTKGETWDTDFLCAILVDVDSNDSGDRGQILDSRKFKLDHEFYGRDGLFEAEQLFAVFENEDIESMINHLNKCRH